jgi:S-adenosylmethionine/arginine decarboxylase-like enzyme
MSITMSITENMTTPSPFGYSYLLDMFGCLPSTANNIELTYHFLETLPDILEMIRINAPVVIHTPRDNGVEMYPDKAGVSGWVPLAEGGIQIQSVEPISFITLEVYSSKKFNPNTVYNFAQETFGFMDHKDFFTTRGVEYGAIIKEKTP